MGTGAGLWVTADAVGEAPPSDETRRLGAELRATLRALFEHLGRRRLVEFLGAVGTDDPGALADLAGWWPELPLDRKVQLLETIEVDERVRLAVTGAGGDVLLVEATSMDGEPSLQVTGQLGDVMKESAQIALSWVRSHAAELGLDADALGRRFHVHFPAGAVPKDGPSAGITMTAAIVSLLTGRRVRSEVGMTGGVTLSGRVLPIGGVKQKVLAARRAGLTEVVLPGRNAPDLDDLPDTVRAAMTIHLVDDVADVLRIALEPAAEPAATAPLAA